MRRSDQVKNLLLAAGALLTQQAVDETPEAQGQKATPERPNIIFILADDMGYGDLACYGNEYIQTPNIDRLARTGTSFTQAYASSGISSPSRCFRCPAPALEYHAEETLRKQNMTTGMFRLNRFGQV